MLPVRIIAAIGFYYRGLNRVGKSRQRASQMRGPNYPANTRKFSLKWPNQSIFVKALSTKIAMEHNLLKLRPT
jgi:hypothetical protein